jgi:GNAT superfamily N-acetyltransferase
MNASSSRAVEIRKLASDEIELISKIDRSEHIDTQHTVETGCIVSHSADFDVPSWDLAGDGEHSAARRIQEFRPVVEGGATLLGVFDGDEFAGLAIVDPTFEPRMAWVAFLHVSRRYRRLGAASALWSACEDIALGAGADSMYVSATPSGSAVGFYLSRGCQLAQPPHPDLFAKEPDDVHLVCSIG